MLNLRLIFDYGHIVHGEGSYCETDKAYLCRFHDTTELAITVFLFS